MKNAFSNEIAGLKFNMDYLREIVKRNEQYIKEAESEISNSEIEIDVLKFKIEQLKMLGNPDVRKSYAKQCEKDGTDGWHVIKETGSGWVVFRTKSKEELEETLGRIGLEIGERGCLASFGKGEGRYEYYELRKKQNKKKIANTKSNVKTK